MSAVLRLRECSPSKCPSFAAKLQTLLFFAFIFWASVYLLLPADRNGQFLSFNPETLGGETAACCVSVPYRNIGRVVNCSRCTAAPPGIGIVTMNVRNPYASKLLDADAILNNHLSYSSKHAYTYYEITSVSTPHREHAKSGQEHLRVLMSKFQVIHDILTNCNSSLTHLLWIDFDAIFTNCAKSIEQALIARAHQLYADTCSADVIFTHDLAGVANTGVVLFKNVEWTHALLQRLIAMTRKYAQMINAVHNAWGDQNIFVAVIMGYNDQQNEYRNETAVYLDALRSGDVTLRYGPSVDDNQTLRVHDRLDEAMAKHVALLSPAEMNFLYAYYIDLEIEPPDLHATMKGHAGLLNPFGVDFFPAWYRNIREVDVNLPFEPFILHFAGSGKPYVQQGTNERRQILHFPNCHSKKG